MASNQYGGQSISLTHLAPFVQISREKIRQEVLGEIEAMDSHPSQEIIDRIVEMRLRREIQRACRPSSIR